jgi:hypothetical protein
VIVFLWLVSYLFDRLERLFTSNNDSSSDASEFFLAEYFDGDYDRFFNK